MMYVRVRLKGGRSFWAQVIRRGKKFTLYRRVNNEGDDFGYYRKDGVLVDKQELVDNSLIVSERPAVFDKKYATLKVLRK